MKKPTKVINAMLAILLIVSFSSCGINAAYVFNLNQNSTQVVLASDNYEVVDRVAGSSEVAYIFSIGGMNKRQLYENAYADMVQKAELNGSKALVNIVTEEHVAGFPPFYVRRTVTTSANVIEFKN